jgi:hypothetical protein
LYNVSVKDFVQYSGKKGGGSEFGLDGLRTKLNFDPFDTSSL